MPRAPDNFGTEPEKRIMEGQSLQDIAPRPSASLSADAFSVRRFPPAALTLSILVCLALAGCVERRMTIRTNVDDQGGALAIIDNREIGFTPVSTGFTYYGAREVRLIKDGYETVTLIQPIDPPWFDSLPVEFFTENLLPVTLRDEREFRYELPATQPVTANELLQRAHELRSDARLSGEIQPTGKSPGPSDQLRF
jgi:hypothetical protein